MAFNFDHTQSGSFTLKGNYDNFSGTFIFPNLPPSVNEYVLLSNKTSSSASISGLDEALANLLDESNLGQAFFLETGYSNGNIPFIESDGYLNNILFPASILNEVYLAPSPDKLIYLNSAAKGDIANVTEPLSSYVLTGYFNNLNNWVKIEDEANLVNSINSGNQNPSYSGSGFVKLSGSDINLNSGFYSGENLNFAVDSLYNSYINTGSLESGYVKESFFDTLSNEFSTSSLASSELNNYETTGDFANSLTGLFQTGVLIPTYLTGKLLKSSTGNAISLNSGASAGNVIVLDENAYINSSLIPYVSVTDTFRVNSTGELTGLNNAAIGDVAIDTQSSLTFILSQTGDLAYQDINNWNNFIYDAGTIGNINLITPDPSNNVLLKTSDIKDVTGVSVSSTISSITSQLNEVNINTETTGHFLSLTGNYSLISGFNAIAETKSYGGHLHTIDEVNTLSTYLNKYSNFQFLGDGSGQSHQSFSGRSTIDNNITGALIFGTSGRATNNYEVSRSISGEIGDAQVSTYIFHGRTTNSNWTDLGKIPACLNTLGLMNSNVMGTTTGVNKKIASINLYKVVSRTNSLPFLIGDDVLNTRYRSEDYYCSRLTTDESNYILQVKGDTGMNWVASVDFLRTTSATTASPENIASFFKGLSNDHKDWFNLENWYPSGASITNAYFLPNTGTNATMSGTVGAFVDLDDSRWVTPNLINTTNVSDENGICFFSERGNAFTGNIIGEFSFFGNSIL